MGTPQGNMKLILAFSAIALALARAAPESAFTYGHAAYTYGPLHCVSDPCSVVPSCNKAHWAEPIGAFNDDTSISDAKITQIYSYGGDVEFWPNKDNEQACWAPADMANCNATTYYDNNNKAAAAVYAAELYCHDDNLGGIQVDLEPYQDPHKESLEAFVTALATNMKDDSGANGCKDAAHPFGRTTSYFTFAHRMRPTFYNESMEPNGIYVFSGYDLKPKNLAFEYNNVSEFAANFEEELTFIPQAIGPNGKFTIALPISASCHEYEQYIPMHGDGCGPACQIYDANADLGIEMYMYVQAWMDILTDPKWGDLFKIKEGGQFIGLSFWVWTYDMTSPPMKWFNNVFLPPTPSDKTLQILKKGLPKLNA